MKNIFIYTLLISSLLNAQELRIKANTFKADDKNGISVFNGAVNVIKSNDELNASKVSIYTNKNHEPTKFIAKGDVSFSIETKKGSVYKGNAGEVIYYPQKKEYHFFKNVYLRQVDEKKEIIGEEVVLKTEDGKAYAKGKKSGPVIMIFNISEDKEK